ncbi:hypothetical protein BDV32DRAFT_122283 [Aspergillus pseudonomiae]|uniref:Uncharacterized protein n=1 Tax=Aspergillus pseudonomiae TaxID=1506151 RepID=A0A5N7D5D6_9EURO|nr:uncharacterized protein BDV37DRAFT_285660 [Aspergillus pseudonomiae]KAB8260867.1 hypothetical protein BDV32DRAFT_122283 [Aspergillus pseudonomiae]KAE8401509.1 hypothetical protein BDV37DRAFT_285660 [Aspergillus pseudonomiae]
MADDPPGAGIAGVVVGAVLLFGAISLVPILIMWHHRRRAAARRASEVRLLQVNGCMRQVTVERWLEELARSENGEPQHQRHYAQETCSICLSTLVVPSSSQDTLPSSPEPACILPPSRSTTALHRHDTLTPDADPPLLESDRTRYRYRDGDRSVLVLNQCNHAFHASCLASWFAYGRYKCPICQTEYSPTDPG